MVPQKVPDVAPYIEEHSRSNVHTSQAVCLGDELDVVSHLVSAVEATIRTRLVRDLEKTVDLLLINADTTSELREPGVSVIASLVDDIHVEVLGLLVEECLAKLPEFVWVGLQDSNTRFVDECRGRMPWLDLLAEDELDFVGVF